MDGRAARSERSRNAIVAAMLELLREGEVRPSAETVAARAGVSLRTLFRHVEDVDELFASAVDIQTHRVADLHRLTPPTGSVRHRVDVIVRHRSRLYEEIGPVRRAALRAVPFHKAVAAGLERSGRELREQLEVTFAPELRGAVRRRRDLVAAVDAATSWHTWEGLRADQGLTVKEAEAVLRLTMSALLEGSQR